MWWLVASVALAAPTAAELEAAWEAWRPQLQTHAVYPFQFTDEEWAGVAEGKVVRRRERMKGTDRVMGLVWAPADIDTTWLAVQDGHGQVVEGFVEELLPGSTFESKLAYQSIDLPWPLATRQWVIRVANNAALRKATGGKVWERTWDLSDQRGAKAEQDKAVWLKVNEGGWFFAEAAGGTIVAYHARTVIGGIVPDEVATRWSFSTLTGMLERVVERIPWVRSHYVGDHPPMLRPGSTEIERF
ncbi:MAG: hypothetical protein KTR31_17960 [Myxococcales bacterium]|nr:hypothetical protein [Myxococcales bacterium]